jgi:hypothetical protein
MPGVEKYEMEIENSCLHALDFFIRSLFEDIESNMHKHHPLCIILLIAFIIVLATTN